MTNEENQILTPSRRALTAIRRRREEGAMIRVYIVTPIRRRREEGAMIRVYTVTPSRREIQPKSCKFLPKISPTKNWKVKNSYFSHVLEHLQLQKS